MTFQSEHKTIARIVKVNHAGEFGAIRIYRAQLWVARHIYPDAVPFLEETLGHELEHCARFARAIPSRNARPCRVMALWGNGGLILGLVTALLGQRGIWICTASVEKTVHRHLEDQLAFLVNRERELYNLISAIQNDEMAHLRYAEDRPGTMTMWPRILSAGIAVVTETMIWLSTWGDSSRMTRKIAAD